MESTVRQLHRSVWESWRSKSGVIPIPVILFADPPLQADIRIRSSIMLSLIWALPDCTTKTSFSLMLVRILTLVSPCSQVSFAACDRGQLEAVGYIML